MIHKYKFIFYQHGSPPSSWWCQSRVTHNAVRDMMRKILGTKWNDYANVIISVSAKPRKGYTKGPALQFYLSDAPWTNSFRLVKTDRFFICVEEAVKIGLTIEMDKIQYLYYKVGKVHE